jgi:ectoine hydroxylase-related dioxygenase (phytanoyl-CoA dioxygenase family)
VHSDIDKPHPFYRFAYTINIPLCDTDIENGSTEVWVGSHRDSCIDQHHQYGKCEWGLTIREGVVEDRRKHSPPIQPSTKKGSLILRDIRLWHAGMPNRTNKPRIMLAFVVQPKWFQAPSKVLLPVKVKGMVEKWKAKTGLEYAAQWVDGDVDHKKVSSVEVDFSTANRRLLELEGLMHGPLH